MSSPNQAFEDSDPQGCWLLSPSGYLNFFSDRAQLSALWSRDAWPDYSRLQSYAI
jgi:hypothetical protein